MTHTMVVTGGTGTLGRPLVRDLVAAGHTVRVLSRHAPAAGTLPGGATHLPVDLRTGESLHAALDGADVVVHCATGFKGDEVAGGHLVAAARTVGVAHLLYISIVGIDRIPTGYYRAKLAVERQLEASGVPWTILRTTQFHDLLVRICQAQRWSPVLVTPSVRFQPIEVTEVAARMAELAAAPPAGRVDEMGGPEVRQGRDLARAYLRAAGKRRMIVPLRLPGGMFAQLRAGANLAPERAVGVRTFEEYLAARYARAS